MNKYLMLSAAAVIAGTVAADARTYCFHFATFDGGDYCDGGRISTGVDGGALSGAARAWSHLNNNCASGVSQGYGLLAKTSGIGEVSVMSDDYFARNYGNFSSALSFILPKKIKDNQLWSVWVGMDGVTFFEVNSGSLVSVGNCQNPAVNHGRKSTLDGVREIIEAHRNAKPLSE